MHAKAWKALFDGYLKQRAEARGEAFVPFDSKDDYLAWVDGKPRYDGVGAFIDALGTGDEGLAAKAAAHLQDLSPDNIGVSAFIRFLASRINDDTSPLPQAMTLDELHAATEHRTKL